ncbi:MAG: hypothetical protein ACRDZX_14870 [Acidimicrobiales bacterium]
MACAARERFSAPPSGRWLPADLPCIARGVDMHLKRGEVLGLVGDNGTGKRGW